ncbi:hypothetical protein LDENG_00233130 [Lucifuga dentata]|nr:hypothetical protein LDENG_00233130 [Lucifuga dentata]
MIGSLLINQPSVPPHQDVSLPPILQRRSQVCLSAGPRLSLTSSGSAHSGTPQTACLAQTRHPKAPPHWMTHYLNVLDAQLKSRPSHRLVSAPVSESRDSYRHLNAARIPVTDNFRNLLTLNKHLQPTGFLEPPNSTAHAHYHRHIPDPSFLDVSPAEQLKNLLKSSAHICPPAPADTPPSRCVPRHLITLPFAGKNSEYQGKFTAPPPPIFRENAGPGGGAWAETASGVHKYITEIPKTYETENSNYGSQKVALV